MAEGSEPRDPRSESARPPSPLPPLIVDSGIPLECSEKSSLLSPDVVFYLPDSEKLNTNGHNNNLTHAGTHNGILSAKQDLEALQKKRDEWRANQKYSRCMCCDSSQKAIKKFYRTQEETIQAIEEAESDLNATHKETADDAEKDAAIVSFAAKLSFFLNIALMIAKAVAACLSGSVAVVSSLVDSLVDLVSGAVIFWTSRARKNTNFASYPFGRSRLEPAAIIIISVVMGLASFQIIVESTKLIVKKTADPQMDWSSILMVAATIFVKLGLYLFCRRIDNPSVQTLALDHRNDVVSNAFALLCGWLGTLYWSNIDPIGAICISLYIAYNWWMTGKDQMQVITGRTAPPNVLNKIVWVASHHDHRIQSIDTARAFHLGSGYLTDVHITLDPSMTLCEAHDIGESLQNKLELLGEIEAAFVHLDYENDHRAETEHAFLGGPRKRTESSKSDEQSSPTGVITGVKTLLTRSRDSSSKSQQGLDTADNQNTDAPRSRVSSVKQKNSQASIAEDRNDDMPDSMA